MAKKLLKKDLEEMVKEQGEFINKVVQENFNLKNKLKESMEEIERLKSEFESVQKYKNEHNVGRKEKFSDKEKAKIKMLRLEGNSYRAIAKQMNCGVGTVHKIIKEMEQE